MMYQVTPMAGHQQGTPKGWLLPDAAGQLGTGEGHRGNGGSWHISEVPPQPKYPRTHADELKPLHDLSERIAEQNNSAGKDRA
jgi:hypothetical protein